MSAIRQALVDALAGQSLPAEAMGAVLDEMLDGEASPVLVAAWLTALRLKGESAEELAGGVAALLRRAVAPPLKPGGLLDTAGTGGDGRGTFNISTAAALVAAAAGVKVAKHGNRAASGAVGAADLLEHLGVRIEVSPAGLAHCLERAGICFIFAPRYHPALARVAGLRRELGVRTIFNLLGALANPCQPECRLLGVGESKLVRPMAEALMRLEVAHAMVVHSQDGMDELSAAAPSRVAEIHAGRLSEYLVDPRSLGLHGGDIVVSGVAQAAARFRAALAGEDRAAHDVLVLNGGAAIYVGGRAPSLKEGVEVARTIVACGRALDNLERLRQASWEEA
ncbi:MAG TPA: anthranilate phosphoribosyltransferase [Candidatus Binataceae bacterium]|nr:anthranilate phosphoribosyltransferase [Candidatus Binataceae bacterium]